MDCEWHFLPLPTAKAHTMGLEVQLKEKHPKLVYVDLCGIKFKRQQTCLIFVKKISVESKPTTVCPQKIWSLGIDTILDAIFYEDSIKNKV